jgi:single-strand DNA-binding protein
MSDANTVFVSGNLARDPEVKYTPKGTAVVEFTIASNKRWTTEAGEKKEAVTFVGCVCWGAKGEAFAKYHRKGQRALIEGELCQETWEDKETGKKREKTKVRVREWFFMGSSTQEGTAQRPSRPQRPEAAAPQSGVLAKEPEPDDVPF